MHVGPYKCTFPITGKKKANRFFNQFFFLLSQQCFVRQCVFNSPNIPLGRKVIGPNSPQIPIVRLNARPTTMW